MSYSDLHETISKTNTELTVNSSNCDRSLFFRHEYDGVLVYDFYSRLSTSDSVISELNPEPESKKPRFKSNIEYGKEYIDRIQFETMGFYSAQRQFIPKYTLVIPQSHVLKFDSRFESGNLHKAIKVSDNEYNLLLNYDTETLGHTQWYYFSVKPYKSNHTVRFNIINLMKYQSLYSEGMKPAVLSKYKYNLFKKGWHRDGFNIGYYQNSYKRKYVFPETPKNQQFFYTLTFSYTFENLGDEVFFAYSYPYTYTDLQTYLSSLSSNPALNNILKINPFCKTLSGNSCYLLTITSKINSYAGCKEENIRIQKSSAARKYLKIKESKEEAKMKATMNNNGKK